MQAAYLKELSVQKLLATHLGNPSEFTMKQLAEAVAGLCAREVRIKYCPLPQDDPKQRQPDITRAQTILGWSPAVPLQEGLVKTIAYFAGRVENVLPEVEAHRT